MHARRGHECLLQLGLGPFVTAAINGANIEGRLGLDPLAQDAIAVCACGVPAEDGSPLDPRFEPYDYKRR